MYSRCLRCNAGEFLYISQHDLSEMTKLPLDSPAPHSHDSYSNDQKARSWTLRMCGIFYVTETVR